MRKFLKRTFLIITSVFILFNFSVPVFGSEEEGNQSYNDLLVQYRHIHQEIIVGLEYTKKNVDAVFSLIQEINKVGELRAKNINKSEYKWYDERYKELENSLLEKYGIAIIALAIHPKNFAIEGESAKKIEEILNETISNFKDTLDCFGQESSYLKLKACENFKQMCGNYGSDNGNMYYYELTKELTLKKVDVSENDADLYYKEDDLNYKGANTVLKDKYQFCRLLSLTSSPFSPASIRKEEDGMDFLFIKDFWGTVLPEPSIFQKTCFDAKPSEQRVKRLIELKSQFPDYWTIKRYHDDYMQWWPACREAATDLCKNTYAIKGQIILAYPTVACKNREVTREDVENDIRLMGSNADKLKHSMLLDEIDACQKAHDSGLFWRYEEPTLSNNCKKEVPQIPKRKK